MHVIGHYASCAKKRLYTPLAFFTGDPMLLLSTLQQFDINPADYFLVLATAGLAFFFIMAALTTPLLAVSTESLYAARHKAFYDKCALQITQAAFGIGIFIFLVLCGGAVYLTFLLHPGLADGAAAAQPLSPLQVEDAGLIGQVWASLGHMFFFVPPLIAIILLFIYLVTWTPGKRHRAPHLILGWLSALYMLALLFCGPALAYSTQPSLLLLALINKPMQAFSILLADFFSSPALPLMFVCLVCMGLAAGAGLSQLWLIMRRFKADYGRDYYVFAMCYCAKAALGFTLASLLIGCAAYLLLRRSIPSALTQPQDIGIAVIALGLPLSCCLLWLTIAKSETPLRHKPGAFFACLFLFIALCAQLLMLATTFPMA